RCVKRSGPFCPWPEGCCAQKAIIPLSHSLSAAACRGGSVESKNLLRIRLDRDLPLAGGRRAVFSLKKIDFLFDPPRTESWIVEGHDVLAGRSAVAWLAAAQGKFAIGIRRAVRGKLDRTDIELWMIGDTNASQGPAVNEYPALSGHRGRSKR